MHTDLVVTKQFMKPFQCDLYCLGSAQFIYLWHIVQIFINLSAAVRINTSVMAIGIAAGNLKYKKKKRKKTEILMAFKL